MKVAPFQLIELHPIPHCAGPHAEEYRKRSDQSAGVADILQPVSAPRSQATARRLGLEVTTSESRRAEDIVPAFEALRSRADALYLCPDALLNTNRTRIKIWRWARD